MITYMTLNQAIEVYGKTIGISGGGAQGFSDEGRGRLDSVLEHIQNDDYYPAFEDKLTHLFFSVCTLHCFVDGNKRAAITLCAQMLLLNGYLYCSSQFIREMENVSYHVAASNIDKELLHEIITAIIQGEEEDEELKLKILHAIERK